MIRHKKAEVAIVVLVVLVFVLFAATLFAFLVNTQGIDEKISEISFLENTYLKESEIEFFINVVGKESFENTLHSFEGDFTKSEFEDKFAENFKKEFTKYDFDQEHLLRLKQYIRDGKFKVVFNDNVLEFTLDEFLLTDSQDFVKIKYQKNFVVRFEENI